MLIPVLAFTAAAALLTVTPGLDTALVIRTAIAEGKLPALRVGAGILLGCLTWGILVAFGLGALLAASEAAYAILRLAGAAYLVWLGVKLLRTRTAERSEVVIAARGGYFGAGHFGRGLLTNLLNPKVGVFYVSFLPQFVPVQTNVAGWTMALACIHALLGLAWFALLIAATDRMAGWIRHPSRVRWLDRLTGGLLVALGVKLALEPRA